MTRHGRILLLPAFIFAATIALAQTPAAQETILHNFTSPPQGANPQSRLLRDAAGNLYGTAPSGGSHGAGVVFKVAADGAATILYNFTGGSDGATPFGGLIADSSGNLYGTAYQGGTANAGVIYKIDASGNQTVLYHFTGGSDGRSPHCTLAMDHAGNLFGTTEYGGSESDGVVFRLSVTGQETVIHSFQYGTDGIDPIAGVTLDSRGYIYGTTQYGGEGFEGIAYALDTQGNETVLHSFTGGTDGGTPAAGVTLDAAGNLYGTTTFGGTSVNGVVYKLTPSGQETILHNFTGQSDGGDPYSGLIRDSAGNLYGTTIYGGAGFNGVVYKINAAGAETVLYNFPGGTGGSEPYAGVTADGAGNLYGDTFAGGLGYGIIYSVSAGAAAQRSAILFTFPPTTDGFLPFSSVIRDAEGNLLGTTSSGGASAKGTVYEVTASGVEKVLYSFGGGADGAMPYGALARDKSGNLYGTTSSGGSADSGIVYKLSPGGEETILHTFTGGTDGGTPFSGVALDAAGNVYGATAFGGSSFSGVVYKLDPSGSETILHTFENGADGIYPYGGVTLDAAGNLYGTTYEGGVSEFGTVYKLDPTGHETILYAFDEMTGGFPESSVTLDAAGNIYGTTAEGGSGFFGTVYKLTPSGVETVLYSFTNGSDGGNPFYSPVIRDAEGNLYGTTNTGGTNNLGVLFKIDPAGNETVLHSFALTNGANPLAGVVGSASGALYGATSSGGTNGAGVVFEFKAAAN